MINRVCIIVSAFSLVIGVMVFLFLQMPNCTSKNLRSDRLLSASHIQKLQHEYETIKTDAAMQRNDMGARYLKNQNQIERAKIIQESRAILLQTLTEKIFPAWYGTNWDFNGVTRTPGKGQIACGSFVVFTLQDAGFQIPSKMLRQPAENIIRNLIRTEGIGRFPNHVPMDEVIEWIEQSGEGLFLTGLDCHVGFIIATEGRMTFCHSNYFDPPRRVVNHDLLDHSPLTESNFRIIA